MGKLVVASCSPSRTAAASPDGCRGDRGRSSALDESTAITSRRRRPRRQPIDKSGTPEQQDRGRRSLRSATLGGFWADGAGRRQRCWCYSDACLADEAAGELVIDVRVVHHELGNAEPRCYVTGAVYLGGRDLDDRRAGRGGGVRGRASLPRDGLGRLEIDGLTFVECRVPEESSSGSRAGVRRVLEILDEGRIASPPSPSG